MTDSCSVRSRLPADTRAPSMARSLLDRAGCTGQHAGVRDRARLLVSELVTNAVRHGAAPVSIEIACDRSAALAVRVTDGGRGRPALRSSTGGASALDRHGGWGLVLVDLLSDEWGVDEAAPGKTVWFRLHRLRASPIRPPR